jgi:hypothetical protein
VKKKNGKMPIVTIDKGRHTLFSFMDFPSQTHDIVHYLSSQPSSGNININDILEIIKERYRIGKTETLFGPLTLVSFLPNTQKESVELLDFVESVFEKQGDQMIVCWYG